MSGNALPIDLDKPLYSSRLIDTYVKYIKVHLSHVDINTFLRSANMEPCEVADENHWFSQRQVNTFHERLRSITGNQDIARQVGRFAASPGVLGQIRLYTIGLIGPAKAYEMIGKYAMNLTRSSRHNARKISRNKVEISVIQNPGVKEMPFQCENRMGYFEAIATVFNHTLPSIEHKECVFKGGQRCVYEVTWAESDSSFWKRLRNYTAAICAGALGVSVSIDPSLTLSTLLPFSALLVAMLGAYAYRKELRELRNANDSLRDSTDKLLHQANINYDRALYLNSIGSALIKNMDIDSIFAEVIRLFEENLHYDRGLILLANEDKSKLVFRSGFGYSDKHQDIIQNAFFRLDKKESRGVFTVSFKEQKPFLISSLNDIEKDLSSKSYQFAKELGAKSFICCPIVYEGESLGILAVDNVTNEAPLLQSDINFLMSLTHTIGISINNVRLFDKKEKQLKSMIQAMAATIDARDPMTSGHSEKVTEFAVGICGEIGLSKNHIEVIRVASLLHDYGKIGIKDSILMKSGPLDPSERDEIKTHSEKTEKILSHVNFDGIYQEVPRIAGSHHERYDGSGYPRGLKGDDISLGARILAVADFFEAITSKRHYRDPMPTGEALVLLREKSGTDFDSKIVNAFLSFYDTEYSRRN